MREFVTKVMISFLSLWVLNSCGSKSTDESISSVVETSTPPSVNTQQTKEIINQYATTKDARLALTFKGLPPSKSGALVTLFSEVTYIGSETMAKDGRYRAAIYQSLEEVPSDEHVNAVYDHIILKAVVKSGETIYDTEAIATSIKTLYVKINGYDGVHTIDLQHDPLTQTIDVNHLSSDTVKPHSTYLARYLSNTSPTWLSANDTEWNYALDQYGQTSSISSAGGISEQYKPGSYSNGVFTLSNGDTFNILDETHKGLLTSNVINGYNQAENHPEFFVQQDSNRSYLHTPLDYIVGINSVDANGNPIVEGDVFTTFYYEGAGYRTAFGFYPYYDSPDLNQSELDKLSVEARTAYNEIKNNPTPQEIVTNFASQGYLLPYYYFKSLISGPNRVAGAKIIFANTSAEGSGGEMGWGDTIKIGRYPVKTKFIFFIVADGWDTTNGGIKTANFVYSSYSLFNPELDKSYFDHNLDESYFTYYQDKNKIVPDHVHVGLLKIPVEDINGDGFLTQSDIDAGGKYSFFIGFEDLFRLGASDNDFEDVVFSVSMIPDGVLGNGDSNTTLTTIAEPDDADGDGIKDNVDEFPGTDCPSTIINNVTVYTVGTDCYNYNHARAYRSYTPGAGIYGTLLFEDNWEYDYDHFGDYDMNDLVLRYNVEEQKDANQLVKTIIMDMEIQADGASYSTGFSIGLPRAAKDNIESYSLENISRYTSRSTLDLLKEFTLTDYLTSTLEPTEYLKDCHDLTYDATGNILTVTDGCSNASGTIFDITDSIERVYNQSLFDVVQNSDLTVLNQMSNMGFMRSRYTNLLSPDNEDNVTSEHIRLKITFTTPIATSLLTTPPYNPFIVVAHSATEMQTKQYHVANGEANLRREIHLPSSSSKQYPYTSDALFVDTNNSLVEDFLSNTITTYPNDSDIKRVATTWLKKLYDDGFMSLDPTFWTDRFGTTANNLFVLQTTHHYPDALYEYKLPWALNIPSSFKHICSIMGPDVIFGDTERFYNAVDGTEKSLSEIYNPTTHTSTELYNLLRDHGFQIYFAYPYYIYWAYSGFTKHTDWYNYPITNSYFDGKLDATVLTKYRKLFNCSSDPIVSDSFRNRLAEESSINTTYQSLDKRPPQITLNDKEYMTIELFHSFKDPGATAIDYQGNSIVIQTKGEVNPNKMGLYTIAYIANDNNGNQTIKYRNVEVVAKPNSIYLLQQYQKFTTINDAIAGAKENETIIIGDGIYNTQINIDKNITLRSLHGSSYTVITGESNVSNWNYDNILGLYYAPSPCGSVKNLFIEGRVQKASRYPKQGFILGTMNDSQVYTSDSNQTIIDETLLDSLAVTYYTEWAHFASRVNAIYENTITLNQQTPYSGSIFQSLVFMQSLKGITEYGEWGFHNGNIYIKSTTIPTNATVECTEDAIIIGENAHDVTIEGLSITKFKRYGIHFANNNGKYLWETNRVLKAGDKIIIKDNNFSYMDSAIILRSQQEESNSSVEISHNTINNMITAGVLLSNIYGAQIYDNIISNIAISPNTGTLLGDNEKNGGHGIELASSSKSHIYYNYLYNIAYDGISFKDSFNRDTDRVGGARVIENNYIENALLSLNDGGCIETYTWFNQNVSANRDKFLGPDIIRNNIMNHCRGYYKFTKNKSYEQGKGIYIDNNSHQIDIYHNTILNSGFGLMLHESDYINVHDNTIVADSRYELHIDNTFTNRYIGNNFLNNILIGQPIYEDDPNLNPIDYFQVSLRNATYGVNNVSFLENSDYNLFRTMKNKALLDKTHQEWIDQYGLDIHSRVMLNRTDKAYIFINPTNQNKVLSQWNGCKNIDEIDITSDIVLQPYSSVVLFHCLQYTSGVLRDF